jgi:hypothetical protein
MRGGPNARSGVVNADETLYRKLFDSPCQAEYSHVLCSRRNVTAVTMTKLILWTRLAVTQNYTFPWEGES